MQTFYSEDHRLHFPQAELSRGQFVTPYERPSRVEFILNRLKERQLTDIHAPDTLDFAPIRRLHDPGFLEFLEKAWEEWKADGNAGEIIPTSFPVRRMGQRPPKNIDGKAGFYAMAGETAITAGTWDAVQSSCASAQSAQRLVAGGAEAAFALCRPPGHHATRDMFGGYCFINNASVVAEMFTLMVPIKSPYWISTFITAMVHKTFSTSAMTCFSPHCTVIPKTHSPTSPAIRMKPAMLSAQAITPIIPCAPARHSSNGHKPCKMPVGG